MTQAKAPRPTSTRRRNNLTKMNQTPTYEPLILASGSTIRQTLLANTGFVFQVQTADIDERAIEADLRTTLQEGETSRLAEALASAKAASVSKREPSALVIGADQILDHAGEVLHKAPTQSAAIEKLRRLQGSSHRLTSAAALARGGDIVWTGSLAATLSMRPLTDQACAQYVAKAGVAATESVGAYRLEELGAHLFDRIEGDYFTILGMPLLPLLSALRAEGHDPLNLRSKQLAHDPR